jgi:uncharacterized delta-60 repeat protein/RHS repeat-associated protein
MWSRNARRVRPSPASRASRNTSGLHGDGRAQIFELTPLERRVFLAYSVPHTFSFNDDDTTGWTGGTVQTSSTQGNLLLGVGVGEKYFGDMTSGGSASLTLGDDDHKIPAHTALKVSFDLYVIDEQPTTVLRADGTLQELYNAGSIGLNVDDGEPVKAIDLRDITRSEDRDINYAPGGNSVTPADHVHYRLFTSDFAVADSVYRVEFTINHFGDGDTVGTTVKLSFDVNGLTNSSDPSTTAKWGLDNVNVGSDDCGCSGGAAHGAVHDSNTDVESDGFDGPFSEDTDVADSGNQGASTGRPSLVDAGSGTVVVKDGPSSSRWFRQNYDGSFTPLNGVRDTLAYDGTDGKYVLKNRDGSESRFYDFSVGSSGDLRRGEVSTSKDTNGNPTDYTYDATSHRLNTIVRKQATGTLTVQEQFTYAYISSGTNAGKKSSVTLERKTYDSALGQNDGNTSYTTVREADYAYYDGAGSGPTSTTYGSAGQLQSVQVKDAGGHVLETRYYRYYVDGDANTHGYPRALKYVLKGASYDRFVAYYGNTPLAATVNDSSLSAYANGYYEYDAGYRVSKKKLQGRGSSASAGGVGSYTYTYDDSPFMGGNDVWSSKVTETLPDGNQNITYYNAHEDQLLSIFKDTTSGQMWGTFYAYDENQRQVFVAQPSALSLPTNLATIEAFPDLLHKQDGNYEFVKDASGKIETTSYYDSTTAGDSSPGGAAGLENQQWLQRGEMAVYGATHSVSLSVSGSNVTVAATGHGFHDGDTVFINGANPSIYDGVFRIFSSSTDEFHYWISGTAGASTGTITATLAHTPILQSTTQYFAHDNGQSGTNQSFVYPLASQTLYTNDDGTGARETDFSYTWYSDSLQMMSMTTLRPAIGYAQNGPDTGNGEQRDTEVAYFDAYGRQTWLKDATGFITYTAYDIATGAAIRRIVDADTTVKQLDTFIPANVEVGDIFELTITSPDGSTSVTISYTAAAATVADVTAGLTAAWNGSADALVNSLTATDNGASLSLTPGGDNAPFYVSASTSNGASVNAQTLVRSSSADFLSAVPSGLTSNSNVVHLRLTTNLTVDGLGRPTKETSPRGSIAYMVYHDAAHEVRTYQGWHSYASGTNTLYAPTGPVSVSREDRAGSYSEDLTFAYTPGTNATPLGTEAITGSTIRSLSRTHTTAGGQVDESDRYASLAGQTYGTGAASFQIGSKNTNYYATSYGYDDLGRQNKIFDALDTITLTIFDAMGRTASTWVGTNDTPGTNGADWLPGNQGTSSNMVKLSENLYDTYDPAITVSGDSNLTRTTGFANGTTSAHITDFYYDWRDRQVASKSGVLLNGSNQPDPGGETNSASVQRLVSYTTYDNLGEVTQQDQYDGDGVVMVTSNASTDSGNDGVPDAPGTNKLRARIKTDYDDQGRVWRSGVFRVDQSTGATTETALRSWNWYDHRGSLIKTFSPGGLSTKYAYDGAGRVTGEYLTDGGGDAPIAATNGGGWWNAGALDGDHVLEQHETQYDADGNASLMTTRMRFHDAPEPGTNSGDLSLGANTSWARVSFSTAYYDAANRPTDSVDFGTNGGVSISSRPAVVTGRNTATGTSTATGTTTTLVDTGRTEATDYWIGATIKFTSGVLSGQTRTVTGYNGSTGVITFTGTTFAAPASGVTYKLTPNALVNTFHYDDGGRQDQTTDPRGLVSNTYYDLAGRTTKTIANYVDGVTANAADDQTTEYTYDGLDDVVTMKAVVNNTGTNSVFQTTQYVYGVTTGGGSGLNSNDLLAQVKYPDKALGTASTNTADLESFTYDALGEMTTYTDRNSSTHTYSYDVLGRLLADRVAVGSGVDSTVVRLDYNYDTGGRPYQMTSYGNTNGTGTPINQTQYAYNGYGQLTTEYQEHAGAVNTTTSPKVQYAYSEGGTDVTNLSDDNSRLTSVTYPNGRVLRYEYGGSDSLSNRISRLAFLADDAAGTIGNHIEEYSYLGLSTVVLRNRPNANSQLTYIKQSGDSNGDAGDQYTGLDRFGRIVDQRWIQSSGSATLDRFQYKYDANSNPLYKDNKVNSSFSELYHTNGTSGASTSYDGLNRLTDFRRGTLSDANSDGVMDTVSSLNTLAGSSKNWSLDAVGNWNSSTTGTNSAVVRTHDKQNEVTAVGANSLTFDNNGNTKTDETGKQLVYDAWNRLKLVKNSGGSTIQTYSYDAASRRASENSGTATNLYYSNQWQVLEEQDAGVTKRQNVWSPFYVDELIERDRDTDATADGTLDPNFSDTGFGGSGKVVTDFASGDDVARAVAVQPDGKTVVVGQSQVTTAGVTNYNFSIVRYNVDGTLDTTFGDCLFASPGKTTVDFFSDDYAYAVAIQPDGKIVVAGQSGGGDFAVARLTSSGNFDTTFDSDGKLTTSFGGSDFAYAVAIQSDGKIVVGGYTTAGTDKDFAVARYTTTGALDSTFDSDGKATLSGVGHNLDDFGYAMALQDDGKIVVGGQSNHDLTLGRFTTTGAADTTFDSDGIAVADLGGTEEIRGLVAQSDGTIVAAGLKGSDFVIARFTAAGALDTTFGASSGYTATDFSLATDAAYALTRQTDGKFVAGGISGGNFALARYTSGGLLDTTFDTDGKLTTDLGSAVDTAYGLAIGPDYKIVAVGTTGASPNGNFAVARYKVSSSLEERLYAQTDANHDVTSVSDVFGAVKERFAYDPYGAATTLNAGFGTTSDTLSWKYLHQGGRYDSIAGMYSFRHRDFSVSLGRWVEQDPARYVDGSSLYEYVQSRPLGAVDPAGLNDVLNGGARPTPENFLPPPAGFEEMTAADWATAGGALIKTAFKQLAKQWPDRSEGFAEAGYRTAHLNRFAVQKRTNLDGSGQRFGEGPVQVYYGAPHQVNSGGSVVGWGNASQWERTRYDAYRMYSVDEWDVLQYYRYTCKLRPATFVDEWVYVRSYIWRKATGRVTLVETPEVGWGRVVGDVSLPPSGWDGDPEDSGLFPHPDPIE